MSVPAIAERLWSLWARSVDIVLMYHSVVPSDDEVTAGDWLHVPVHEFRAQLDFLSRHFNVVGPDDFLQARRDRRPRVLITFDDGYANNWHVAYPELAARGLPALFFLATGCLGGRLFWWDRLRESMRAIGKQVPDEYYARFKACAPDQLEAELDRYLDAQGASCEPVEVMRSLTWDEARLFAAAPGVTIGCHAHNHEIFSHLDEAQLTDVLMRSKAALREALGVHTPWLSPPNGDFRNDQLAVFAHQGFTACFTTRSDVLHRGSCPSVRDVKIVPRLGVGRGDTAARLMARITARSVSHWFSPA